MDKQARISSIMKSLNELKEVEDQALYSAELSIKNKDWWSLKDHASKLLAAQMLRGDLNNEVRSLQEAIEDEAKAELL